MLRLAYKAQSAAFNAPFTIAKGTKTHQPSLQVSLSQGNIMGMGEVAAIQYYGITVEEMVASLEVKKEMLQRYALTEPHRFWHFLHHLLPGQNFLVSALDMAAWNLHAKRLRKPLYKLLGAEEPSNVLTNYTLGHNTKEILAQHIAAKPWPIYKIKFTSAADLDLLIHLRTLTDATFRVDANESLTYDEVVKLLPELEKLGVELLEQPLPKQAWEEMQALKNISNLPLIADESFVKEEDLADCAKAFHGINIKLSKCGGITPALSIIRNARNLGMKLMLGNMSDGCIATTAQLQLASLVDFIDADGPMLLQDLHCDGLHYREGYVTVQEA